MGIASESLSKIVENMSGNAKVEAVFVTNIGGKEVPWSDQKVAEGFLKKQK